MNPRDDLEVLIPQILALDPALPEGMQRHLTVTETSLIKDLSEALTATEAWNKELKSTEEGSELQGLVQRLRDEILETLMDY